MSPDAATLEHELNLYKGLVEVSALINGITESEQLLPAIMDVARRVFCSEAASLFLVNEQGELELTASRGGLSDSFKGRLIIPRGKGIAGSVLETGDPVLVEDAYAGPRFFPEADRKTGFRTRSILCAALERNGRKVGVL